MIQRVVLIKLNEANAHEEGRLKVASHAMRALSVVPGVVRVDAGVAADEAALGSWDVNLIVSFESIGDVARYLDDPDHRAFVDEFLAERAALVKAWSFERHES